MSTIANTTLEQLGGANKLKAMVGATNFSYDSKGTLTFSFKSCRKANIVSISLSPMDLYDIEFSKMNTRSYECKTVKTFEGVYAENLKSVIEEFTGLYLSI